MERGSKLPLGALPQPQRVLIVDNDPNILVALRLLVESDGHVATVAMSGEAGIAIFLAALHGPESFSVVMTDMAMPNIDGRTVAKAVKAASPGTLVLLVSGSDELSLGGAGSLLADFVLVKPPKRSDLRKALATL